jgi:hypothetical protein
MSSPPKPSTATSSMARSLCRGLPGAQEPSADELEPSNAAKPACRSGSIAAWRAYGSPLSLPRRHVGALRRGFTGARERLHRSRAREREMLRSSSGGRRPAAGLAPVATSRSMSSLLHLPLSTSGYRMKKSHQCMTGGARLEVKGFSKVTAAQLNIVSCIP